MPEKQFACNLSDVAQDKPFKAFVNDRDYGIYQIGDEYFALRNKCPHRGGSICEGPTTGTAERVDINKDGPKFNYVKEHELVRCSWHGWEFDIKSGQCLADSRLKARKVETRVENSKIYLML